MKIKNPASEFPAPPPGRVPAPVPLPATLTTDRLVLRRWRASDLQPFAEMNANDEVMRFFPRKFTRDQTAEMIERLETSFINNGFGLWALETRTDKEFLGYTGLIHHTFEAHFTPCIEVGWRLSNAFWGKGYAPEAARAALIDGFSRFDWPEIVSMTALINTPSIRVMQKLGMTCSPADNFIHPNVINDPRLNQHVLYRISRSQVEQWNSREK